MTSFLYHWTETLRLRWFMHPGSWHRLDNIGSITCFQLLFLYLCGFRDTRVESLIKFFGFGIVLVLQESGPWVLSNTIIPVVLFACLPVVKFVIFRSIPTFHRRNLAIGGSMLGIAMVFFVLGLDDHNDYMRWKHGIWHFLAGISSIWMWQSVRRDLPPSVLPLKER